MALKSSYFKIGLFVISATVVGIVGIVILGAGQIFEHGVLVETYLDESVQGLDKGAPVKFRGVPIGKIADIDFVSRVYDQAASFVSSDIRYIMVLIEMNPSVFTGLGMGAIHTFLETEIDKGLRIRWTSTGITGTAYLELDYLDPEANPPLEISWQPRHHRIPSATSMMARITGSAEEFARSLALIDVLEIQHNFNEFLKTLTRTATDLNVGSLSEEVFKLTEGLNKTNQRLQELLEKPEIETIAQDAAATTAGARKLVEQVSEKAETILTEFQSASASINEVAGKLNAFLENEELKKTMGYFARTAEHAASAAERIDLASEDLPQTIALMKRTLRRIDALIATQENNVAAILDNLRAISGDLRDITRDAKRYPSHLIFGEPPPRSEPAKK